MSRPKNNSTQPTDDPRLTLAQKTNLRAQLKEAIGTECRARDSSIPTSGIGALAETLYNSYRGDFDPLFGNALPSSSARIIYIKRLINRLVRSGGLIVHEGCVEVVGSSTEPAHV